MPPGHTPYPCLRHQQLCNTALMRHTSPAAVTLSVCCPQNKRYALLGAFAFGQGLSVGPLVEAALAISPAIVMTAALATSAIFASFTLSALVTKRRWGPTFGTYFVGQFMGLGHVI